jgi:hypothetical protein
MVRVLAAVVLVACGSEPAPDSAAPAPASDEGKPFIAPPFAGGPAARPIVTKPAPPPPPGTIAGQQGEVLETMSSGGYTYVRADLCGTETWIAGPPAELGVGDTVVLDKAMPMNNFKSKTLDRTFEKIVFARALGKRDGAPDCSQVAAVGAPPPSAASANGKRQGKVLETMSSGGYRYARVDFCGTETWIAGPDAPLEVGQAIETGTGARMRDFPSKTLGRTFPTIDFVGGMVVLPGPPSCG